MIDWISLSLRTSFLFEVAAKKEADCLRRLFKSAMRMKRSLSFSVSLEKAIFIKPSMDANEVISDSVLSTCLRFLDMECSNLSIDILSVLMNYGKNILVLIAYFNVISLIIAICAICLIIDNDFYWESISW